MTPNEIKGRLIMIGVKSVDIADKFEISEASVSRVIRGESVSDRVQREVARHLGEPVEAVFPERYKKRQVSPRRAAAKAEKRHQSAG